MHTNSFFHQKSVLVTGGAGFIGTNLITQLKARGAHVTATLFKNQPQISYSDVNYIKCDLTNFNDCMDVTRNVDFVFMAGANSSGAEVIQKTPLVHLTPNLIMNSQMLAASYANHVKKFCFISSNTVYPDVSYAVKEDDVSYEFFSKYYIVGWMKQFSEIMCDMYSNKISSPMDTLIVRPGNLYGPFDKFTEKNSKVIAALIRRAIERQNPILVWGDGEDLKDFLYIEDFIDAMLAAFKHSSNYGVFNIASGKPATINSVLEIILKLTNHADTIVNYDKDKPTMIPKRLINIDRIQKATGWSPATDLEAGLSKTIKWYNDYFQNLTPEEKLENMF